jgi:hypothetical protein
LAAAVGTPTEVWNDLGKKWLIDNGKDTADEASWEWKAAPKAWEAEYDLPLTGDSVSRVITWAMSYDADKDYDYAASPGTQFNEGSVNFNLEYVPFNVTTPKAWEKRDKDSNFTLDGKTGLPVWIIRNGLNEEAQDEKTAFDARLEGSNGNGAAAFKVKHRYWVTWGKEGVFGNNALFFRDYHPLTDFPEFEYEGDPLVVR